MKYYLDEDLSPKIVEILTKHKIDAVSAHDVGMTQASDMEQLEYASSKGRCLVTRNRNDFSRLTVQFFNDHRPHAGILIIPHTLPCDNFSLISRAVIKYDSAHSGSINPYGIDFLKQ